MSEKLGAIVAGELGRGAATREIFLGHGSRAVGLQLRQMFLGPATKPLQRLDQGSSESGQRVFNLRRHHGVDSALDQSVALEATQSLRQHLLRDTADLALQGRIPFGPLSQYLDNEGGPFVRDSIEDKTRGTLGVENRPVAGSFSHGLN